MEGCPLDSDVSISRAIVHRRARQLSEEHVRNSPKRASHFGTLMHSRPAGAAPAPAACNATHTIEARLPAGSCAVGTDRQRGALLTQEFVAQMLGCRTSVSVVANTPQQADS